MMKMVNNRIAECRRNIGITQQDLAKRIGREKSYIQRIEGGHEAIKFDTAFGICEALGVSFVDLFPNMAKIIEIAKKKGKAQQHLVSPEKIEVGKKNELYRHLLQDSDLRKALEKAGIDMFIERHHLYCELRGGGGGDFEITTPERKRILESLQCKNWMTRFAEFSSGPWLILINLDHLIFAHFLFDRYERGDNVSEEALDIEIILSDRAEPQHLSVEKDEMDPEAKVSAGSDMHAYHDCRKHPCG